MPSRNTIRESLPDGVYHAYNRGVERRTIFMDHHDYQRFKSQLRKCLALEPTVALWAFCLMPNHFHLLLRQTDSLGVSRFMHRLMIVYVMYFNSRYNRVGPLLQGKYKASRIVGDYHLMHASRYIHLNPERAGLNWRQHQHSSVHTYLRGRKGADLADPAPVLALFDLPEDYERFLSRRKIRSRAKHRNQPTVPPKRKLQ